MKSGYLIMPETATLADLTQEQLDLIKSVNADFLPGQCPNTVLFNGFKLVKVWSANDELFDLPLPNGWSWGRKLKQVDITEELDGDGNIITPACKEWHLDGIDHADLLSFLNPDSEGNPQTSFVEPVHKF